MGGFSPANHKSQHANTLLKLILIATVSHGAHAEKLVDGIAALVNSKPILYSDVQKKIESGPLVLVNAFPAKDTDTDYLKALQDQINYKLIAHKAKDLQIEMEESDIDSRITSIAESNKLNIEQLKGFLKQQGKTFDDYRADIKAQMLVFRFKGRWIIPRIKITEKDVEAFYLKKTGGMSDAVELSMRQIFIKTAEVKAGGDQPKAALADDVYAKLKGGYNFLKAEKIYSDLDSGRNDTAPTIYRLKDFTAEIRKEVESLNIDEFTKPIRSAAGYHIFYLVDRKFRGTQEFIDQKEALENELRAAEIERTTEDWLKNERARADIKVLMEKAPA